MLIHIRYLGIRNNGKRGYMWAEFECPKCGKHIELMKHQGKAQKQCQQCFRKYHMKTQIKHGDRYTRLYRTWINMRQRCNNIKSKKYQQYGAKGVSICTEWEEYINFKQWAISSGYKDNLTIDRIDVLGNYEPSNCQWITNHENAGKDKIAITKEQYKAMVDDISLGIKIKDIYGSRGLSRTAYYNARNRYDNKSTKKAS